MNSNIIESLELRQLLAFSANINFQPDGAPVPSGYRVDTGAAYGLRANGWTYGWNTDNRANARDRGVNSDQRLDTLNHMQVGGSRSWQIAIPNGSYTVQVTAGDPSYFDSVYRINVEGTLAINATPSSSSRFKSGTVTVKVSDGRLTISNASGAVNNKINYLTIRDAAVQPPQPAGWSRGPDLPVALGEVAAGIINGKMYVVGDGSGKTLVYDFSTDRAKRDLGWSPRGPFEQSLRDTLGRSPWSGACRRRSSSRHLSTGRLRAARSCSTTHSRPVTDQSGERDRDSATLAAGDHVRRPGHAERDAVRGLRWCREAHARIASRTAPLQPRRRFAAGWSGPVGAVGPPRRMRAASYAGLAMRTGSGQRRGG